MFNWVMGRGGNSTKICPRLRQPDRREQESLTVNFGIGLWPSKLLQARGAPRKNAMPFRFTIKFESSLGGDVKLLAQLFIQSRQVKMFFRCHQRQ
jgi:hypothetical protein